MFISPMLLHKSNHPFDDDSYITELKLSRPNYKKPK
jgi:DNA ligase-1